MPGRVHLSAQEARALGYPPAAGARVKPRTTKREAKGPWHTQCVTCGQEFNTKAAEDAHLQEHAEGEGHRRYAIIVGYGTAP